ncbi:MAG: hypothetical protein H7099_04965 [Gemmatimonadaceae bacterium]|nr:hypothetical protein [Gemmatimonadaceae bacterium]
MDAARLPLGVDSLDIYLLSGGAERRVGRLWDELQRVDVAGASLARRVYRTENAVFGPTLDTTYSKWPDLRPRAHWSEGRTSAVEVAYRGDSVVGHRSTTLGTVVPITRRLPRTVTDGASFDLLVRASVLTRGLRLSSTAYLAAADSVALISALVTGDEQWRTNLGGEIVNVWVVQMDYAGLASTLWIDKATHALIRQTIRLAPDITIIFSRPQLTRVGG